jgi:CDP-glucose 4,6-dehydratase
MVIDLNFWNKKKVLVTGHTGFKGSWLVFWLKKMGAVVYGIGLQPNNDENNLFTQLKINEICDSTFLDINQLEDLKLKIKNISPDIVFHLAAQSLVRDSYRDPINTFMTNIMGSMNLLESIKKINSVRSLVMITTDKVYENNEWYWPYRERDQLGGYDPYSSSKAASEILIKSYYNSFYKDKSISVATARAGNIIGGGDWSSERLIPDAVRAWKDNNEVIIRNPNSIRPWQYILDPLRAYIVLAQYLWINEKKYDTFNFGPSNKNNCTVLQLIEQAKKFYDSGSYSVIIKDKDFHEASLLTLDSSKAHKVLKINNVINLNDAIERTMHWYQKYYNGEDAIKLCNEDIDNYYKKYDQINC